ncbi:HPr family phosphocarrier protein [Anaerobranca gottschalkii]|uniref:Phosphocarrier protein HPr n=1 Tax=Anaerobranca gottschalkii DSM 13577 TaxID=1120990 RepID=A0A1H9ZRS3_9FIRM|nr:HPr family phosphocarrier protein [Anaerobranca gottschalkii]SES84470.1 phosphocarrier protein [Anaerobranca gottschalkii DSM 13577]
MVETKGVIKIPIGLHARPAVIFIQKASEFTSNIKLIKDEFEVDGKSIMGVMSLALGHGEEVTIRAEGEDEQEAVETLIKLLEELA